MNEAEFVEDLMLIWIKIQNLPIDTVTQSVERWREKPNACVRNLASITFLFAMLRPFLSACLARR